MTWPITFGSLPGGSQPLSDFDTMFNQTAAMIDIPSSASGTNAISLTPLVNCPSLTAYTEFCAARFRAVGASTGPVTAQINGLGFLPAYHADGTTQATSNDILNTQEYVVRYSAALNGGAGGWFLEGIASAAAGTATTTWTPGGRLTFVSATPVMSSTQATPQNVFYAPYNSPYVPIYNGTTLQMYNFTASQGDQVGLTLALAGSASWPINTNFDVFVTLSAGNPILCTVPWTNQTTRATALAIFGGFLTNGGSTTARVGAASTITLAINQGTYVGTFATAGTAGQSIYQFGGAASGGTAGLFYLYNYYNQVLVNSVITDSGASYTYNSATVRQARASAGNGFTYVQGTSEKAAHFTYTTVSEEHATLNSPHATGIGVNVTNAFTALSNVPGTDLNGNFWSLTCALGVSSTGLTSVNALESANTNASTFDFSSLNKLWGQIWL